MKDIINNLPFNSYDDLFNAIVQGKATVKIMRSDCSQISGIKHPYFSTLGIYIGFLITTIYLIYFSINLNNYWLLLIIPVNLVLSSIIIYIPKLKIIACIILILDLFIFKLSSSIFILCLDIILIQFFYDIWWNIIYRQAIEELINNEEAFLWSWNRCGLSIEDCYGNMYDKLNISIKENQ